MNTRTLTSHSRALSPTTIKWCVAVGMMVVIGTVAAVFQERWLPQAGALLTLVAKSDRGGDTEGDSHAAEDAHGHDGHDEANSLELSPQARKNAGLTTTTVELQTFVRTATIPAFVIGRPGRSVVEVTAPLGGRVTRIYAIKGEAVEPGQPLFDLRLMHEELVQAQTEFLRTAEELDVVAREIKRLNSIKVPGAIAGKTVRLREYEQQKLRAVFNAQHQSLLLHGLSQEQVTSILEDRMLVQGVTVVAPVHANGATSASPAHSFSVRELLVKRGQYVDAGATLCEVMDYGQLFIQGRAFEQDADDLLRAARDGWEITATVEAVDRKSKLIGDLRIQYVDNEVESESRALYFYVSLRNRIVHESKSSDGHRFVTWKYKPGQRMQLHVPVEKWSDRIVAPIDAVAKDGLECFVFQQNGDHFDRVPVHVEYQDQLWTVIANDGSIFPGDVIAASGAHQMQMALKNKAGGAPDPHAGHSH